MAPKQVKPSSDATRYVDVTAALADPKAVALAFPPTALPLTKAPGASLVCIKAVIGENAAFPLLKLEGITLPWESKGWDKLAIPVERLQPLLDHWHATTLKYFQQNPGKYKQGSPKTSSSPDGTVLLPGIRHTMKGNVIDARFADAMEWLDADGNRIAPVEDASLRNTRADVSLSMDGLFVREGQWCPRYKLHRVKLYGKEKPPTLAEYAFLDD